MFLKDSVNCIVLLCFWLTSYAVLVWFNAVLFFFSDFCALKVKPPNLLVVMRPPQHPPPASRQLRPRNLNLAQFPLKHRPHRTLARPFWIPHCPLAMAIPACPTMLACQVCPVPFSTVPLSSCRLLQPSSMHSTSTRLVMADTPILQVGIPPKGLVNYCKNPSLPQWVILCLTFISSLFWSFFFSTGFDDLSQAHAGGDYGKGYGGSSQSQAKPSNSTGKGLSHTLSSIALI